MHQQVIGAVRLLPHLLDDARGHWEGRDTGRADHGVHLVLAEEVQKLCKHHARDGVKDEGDKTQRHDDERFEIDELVGLHREGDRNAEKQRDEVRKVVLRRLRETFEAAALAQQVAEHQKTHERDGHRRDEARDDRDHDGEADAQRTGDVLGIVGHVHRTLFLGGHELDGERLDDRHERHVRVGGNRDGADVIGVEHL